MRYAVILDLDRELRELDNTIPAIFRCQLDEKGDVVLRTTKGMPTHAEMCTVLLEVCLAAEFVRIHRCV